MNLGDLQSRLKFPDDSYLALFWDCIWVCHSWTSFWLFWFSAFTTVVSTQIAATICHTIVNISFRVCPWKYIRKAKSSEISSTSFPQGDHIFLFLNLLSIVFVFINSTSDLYILFHVWASLIPLLSYKVWRWVKSVYLFIHSFILASLFVPTLPFSGHSFSKLKKCIQRRNRCIPKNVQGFWWMTKRTFTFWAHTRACIF